MADLIDRQAAIEAVQEELNKQERSRLVNIWTTAEVRFTIVELILKQLPTAEPKTGRWIADGQKQKHGYEWMHCSVCGFSDIDDNATHTNFCPNCGARIGGVMLNDAELSRWMDYWQDRLYDMCPERGEDGRKSFYKGEGSR